MAYLPIDGNLLYQAYNVVPWTKQGTAFEVGGGYTTTSGIPSRQLLASTNTTMGYYNGQMLAYASGVTSSSAPSGLTAGAQINLDPSSPSGDTGQKIWNGWIICDPFLKYPLPLIDPITSAAFVPLNTILCATKLQGWVIRQQFLYASGTPTTDVTIVNTAVTSTTGINISQTVLPIPNNSTETIFAY